MPDAEVSHGFHVIARDNDVGTGVSPLRIGLRHLVVALALTSPAAGLAQAPQLKVAKTMLPNGLMVLAVEDHTVPSVAYFTYFKVGSRNERPGITGLSHLFEHMMFNG